MRIRFALLLAGLWCFPILGQDLGEEASSTPTLVTPEEPESDRGVRKLSERERARLEARLPEDQRSTLEALTPLLSPAEIDAFITLDAPDERERWLEQWLEPWNADLELLRSRSRLVTSEFGAGADAARAAMLHGLPDYRAEFVCDGLVRKNEVWMWRNGPVENDHPVIFLREGTDLVLFAPDEARAEADPRERLLSATGSRRGFVSLFLGLPGTADSEPELTRCDGADEFLRAVEYAVDNPRDVRFILERLSASHTTNEPMASPVATPTAEIPMTISFPGTRGSRTSVRFTTELPAGTFGDRPGTVELSGTVRWKDEVVDHFRFGWQCEGDRLPVSFERHLLPDAYTADLHFRAANGAGVRLVSEFEVPYVAAPEIDESVMRPALGTEALRLAQDFRQGESRLRLLPPTGMMVGRERFDAIATGDEIASVEFWVDDEKILTRRRPPYTAELDMGELPLRRRIRVIGRNADGDAIAGDDVVANLAFRPFRVRIVSPRGSVKSAPDTRVEVSATVPEGSRIDRIDLYYNDDLLATAYDDELVQLVDLPAGDRIGFLRAVATLQDEENTRVEDVVYVNAPELFDEVEVRYVELPVTVSRRRDDSVLELEDFELIEEGQPVEISRVELVENLPLSIGIAIDTSGSMQYRMNETVQAAAEFFEEVLQTGDRGFVVAFDTEARLVQPWTNSLAALSAGLSTLEAEDYTALYDAVIESLFHFQGLQGQKALIVLTDGADTASRFSLGQAKEYARRTGVPIYPIALGFDSGDAQIRSVFNTLAKDTGGEAFYVRVVNDLSNIYDRIEEQLRSQYLIGFYPDSEAIAEGEWREVRVLVEGRKAKTVRGYYP